MPKPEKRAQPELAREFLQLHDRRKILVLPNAWDVASARIFEDAGFPAIATTSGGIANSLGYPDGQHIPRDAMLDVVRRIAAAVAIPVTADMEAGYSATPKAIADTARQAISAGAVGMNLEDGVPGRPDMLVDLSLQKEIIRAVIEVSEGMHLPFVLNARTDVFLHSIGPAETRLSRALERLNAYREAGAQCLFAPGVTDEQVIAQLARGLSGPLNILAVAGSPAIPTLQRLGVARVSLGSGPMRASLGLLKRMARQLQQEGSFALMTQDAVSYPDANRLFE
jgi:2-methylisocitrate lyase-like PEP mutase family enzyme